MNEKNLLGFNDPIWSFSYIYTDSRFHYDMMGIPSIYSWNSHIVSWIYHPCYDQKMVSMAQLQGLQSIPDSH